MTANSKKPSLDALIQLLDDDDETARSAIVQLFIHYPYELDNIMLQLQECDNPMLRKRSHQLQAITLFKRRRLHLHNIIHRQDELFYLSDALFELHLLWFEKDSQTELAEMYSLLLQDFPTDSDRTLSSIAEFLKEKQFIANCDSTENSDLYMLGAVLDSHCGTNSFMCALIMAVNEDLKIGADLQVIMFEHRFYVLDRSNNEICDVLNHWELRKLDFTEFKTFSRSQLLKYIGSICFCNAVNEDSFRYIQILGEILSFDHSLAHLPYPYGKRGITAEQKSE